jgi:8-oxoguanine deaminase
VLLLENCYHLHSPAAMNPGGQDVWVSNGRIIAVTETGATPDGVDRNAIDERIDCSTCLVLPGFVNTHHHFFQTLTRNLKAAQNAKLFDWLVYHYPVWAGINEEAVRLSTTLATAELLLTGCTCTSDHHYLYPPSVNADLLGVQFDSASEIGIRFAPCRGSMSRGASQGGLPPDEVVQDEDTILSDSLLAIEHYHDPGAHAMRKVILAPCSPFSVTLSLMRESARLARAHGVRLHTHLAETADEEAYCLEQHGKRPLQLMEECEFIGSDVTYAHGIHFSTEEITRLAETGTGVCHCPSSNMRLGSGIARIVEMVRQGVPVSIAVDGSASNDSSDYLGEMRMALLLQRIRYGADALSAEQVVDLGTRGGAAALGFTRSGEIRPGWTADFAIFDLHRLQYAGALSDPLAALLFAGHDHSATHTIVAGRVLVRDGKLQTVDEEQLFADADSAARRLLERAETSR